MKISVTFECTDDGELARIERLLALVRSSTGCSPCDDSDKAEEPVAAPSAADRRKQRATEHFKAAVAWARGLQWTPEIMGRLNAKSRKSLLRLVLGSEQCGNCHTSIERVGETGCNEAVRHLYAYAYQQKAQGEKWIDC